MICGETPTYDPDGGGTYNKSWHIANPDPQNDYDEFWNDIYLFWELLIEKGYDNDNIFVLFGNQATPEDWSHYEEHNVALRYNPRERHPLIIGDLEHITDFQATEGNVNMIFNGLATGNSAQGISQLSENNFLFVWIMSHGGDNNPSENNGNAFLYLYGYPDPNPDYDGLLYDDELKAYLDNINALKKVVFIQAPHSGRFTDELQSDNTIVFTSSNKNKGSYRADDNPVFENVIMNNIPF